MKQTIRLTLCAAAALAMASCTVQPSAPAPDRPRVVIYQMFTRLFGDTCTAPRPWGTAAQNGVGKFADITSVVLDSLHSFGITHVWFTGVPHHASTTDYSAHGIAPDDPDVVKGRAGSPYAVRDYYNVDPDLAVNPDRRLDEFVALVERAHRSGLKVIIDIVPNHVARRYHSPSHPEADLGLNDDTTVVYARDNNFYYVVGQAYQSPTAADLSRTPDGDGFFAESPAKWTGNGARTATPDINDWYETVKVNYGIRPDGTIRMRVWERGTGETLACGTGCCATAVACILNGYTDNAVTVKLLGGELRIEWDTEANVVYMTGPAVTVFEGEIML